MKYIAQTNAVMLEPGARLHILASNQIDGLKDPTPGPNDELFIVAGNGPQRPARIVAASDGRKTIEFMGERFDIIPDRSGHRSIITPGMHTEDWEVETATAPVRI